MKVKDPAEFRRKVSSKFNSLLNDDNKSINLEKGIYNYSLREAASRNIVKKWENKFFVRIYIDRFKTIHTNLKQEHLLAIAKSNECKIHEIAFMTHQEMQPLLWKILLDAKAKKDKMKFENTLEASTDLFTCRKCHSKKCTYYAMQCRSADEPMTLFVTCIDCGQRFKTQ